MALQLKLALKTAGCKLAPQAFKAILKSVLLEKFPGCTDTDVTLDPDKDLVYLEIVRSRVHCPTLSGYVINRTLDGLRKRGDLPRMKARTKATSGEAARVHPRPAAQAKTRRPGPKAMVGLRATG